MVEGGGRGGGGGTRGGRVGGVGVLHPLHMTDFTKDMRNCWCHFLGKLTTKHYFIANYCSFHHNFFFLTEGMLIISRKGSISKLKRFVWFFTLLEHR